MKVYAGAPTAARHYLAADRGRVDDYYLTEGTGVARRFTAGPGGPVVELSTLTGERYESWVAGLDPDTGQPRGRLRTDDRAVRFVEVVVNGPKSWSLAAALHPDVAAAYDAAQDRAAAQILGWLAEHATTRVGPAGGTGAGPGGAAGGRHGAALHVAGRGSTPASASTGQREGVRRREMARPAHRRRP